MVKEEDLLTTAKKQLLKSQHPSQGQPSCVMVGPGISGTGLREAEVRWNSAPSVRVFPESVDV